MIEKLRSVFDVRPQYSDRINRIKEKGCKYPENPVNPVKKPEENGSLH